MEKPELFESEGDDQALSWLASMQPACADALKPDFLYRAGYEAARTELMVAMRRRLTIGSTAVLLVALGVGSLAFQLGSRHGQLLAARQTSPSVVGSPHEQTIAPSADLKDHQPEENANELALANQPEPGIASGANRTMVASIPDQAPALARWWQFQLRESFATSAHGDPTYPKFRLGPIGARWEDLVQFEAPSAAVMESKSVTPATRTPGSRLPLRQNEIHALLNELL